MKKLRFYFLFYKGKFLFPLALSVFIYMKDRHAGFSVFASIVITLIILLYQKFIGDPKKEQLYFYFNQGMNEARLYGFIVLINLVILLSFIYFSQ